MSDLPTARDYAGIHTVSAYCPACNRFAELDLPGLVAAGHGDVPLVRLALRCSECGQAECEVKVSGKAYPGGVGLEGYGPK